MTDDAPKLLPCPFCGGEADTYADRNAVFRAEWIGHVTHCKSCQGRVTSTSRAKSIEMWNSRFTLPSS